MDGDYSIPKRKVPAELTAGGHGPRSIHLFLGQRAKGHPGGERPSDLLNGSKTFLPVSVVNGKVGFVRREAVILLSVAAEHELREDERSEPGNRVSEFLAVDLENGTRVSGTISYLLPRNRSRLQDFLNSAPPFIPLRDGDVIRFVNRRRIAWIETR